VSPFARLDLHGLVADFDGDGADDVLCARFDGLVLFHGSTRGTFEEPGRPVWSITPHLKYGQVLTCGDLDGDGDLDVWLGQYKGPYDRGQMPTPYYDANDGNPHTCSGTMDAASSPTLHGSLGWKPSAGDALTAVRSWTWIRTVIWTCWW